MPRRSTRLESIGYYDIEGTPSISYKEAPHRIFRRRWNRSESPRRQSISSMSISSDNSYFGDNESNYSFDSNESRNSNRNHVSSHNDSGTDNSNNINNGYSNFNDRRESNSRRSIPFYLKIFGFLFFILPLCFGFAYLSSNVLYSRTKDSPVPPTILDTDLNAGGEDVAKHLRELQDELLRLKEKMNYLLPEADTWPNFALESQGARVLQYSKTYLTKDEGMTCFGIPIWNSPVCPRTVIQGHTPLRPGCCWAFAGGRGHLSIALSHPVTISHVTLGHIAKSLSPTGTIISAPREFSVYGLETQGDEGTKLGTFLYDQDGDSVQTFKIPDHKKGVYNYVKFQVESNWGHPDYSCLYSFRVHGKLQ